MYYYLLSSLKRRLILELQDSFSRHPVYEKVVPFIQNSMPSTRGQLLESLLKVLPQTT
jgi:hypothetical protein